MLEKAGQAPQFAQHLPHPNRHEAARENTGRTRDEWFSLLDK
jgi:hypothetical protein